MPAYDLVIRGGTVVDGTGSAPRQADVGIIGNKIVAVGAVSGSGAEEIDASGKLVTPGICGYPHPLRRPGGLGQPYGPVILAWRDHGGDGQLRRRASRPASPRTGNG